MPVSSLVIRLNDHALSHPILLCLLSTASKASQINTSSTRDSANMSKSIIRVQCPTPSLVPTSACVSIRSLPCRLVWARSTLPHPKHLDRQHPTLALRNGITSRHTNHLVRMSNTPLLLRTLLLPCLGHPSGLYMANPTRHRPPPAQEV